MTSNSTPLRRGEPCPDCGKIISAPLSHMCPEPKKHPSADVASNAAMLELYAASYDRMDGRVQSSDVAYDIRHNMIPALKTAHSATASSAEGGSKPVAWTRDKQGIVHFLEFEPVPRVHGSGWIPLYTHPSATVAPQGPFRVGEPENEDGSATVLDAADQSLTADEIVTWLNYFYGKAHALEQDVQAIARSRDEYRTRAYAAENNEQRYLWLRNPANNEGPSLVARCSPTELDEAIDAAADSRCANG